MIGDDPYACRDGGDGRKKRGAAIGGETSRLRSEEMEGEGKCDIEGYFRDTIIFLYDGPSA